MSGNEVALAVGAIVALAAAVLVLVALPSQAPSAPAEASFRVDLATMKVGGKSESAFAKSLDTEDHPNATISLSEPFTLTDAFTSGSRIARTVAGDLTIRGKTQRVTINVFARRDGTLLQAAGSIPINFSRWGIDSPEGLADRGSAEFLLVLHRT
jgi:polyisoprenoid-binding protein YceI